MIIAILGVLKAGGAFVPMEVDHPIKRMSYIVREVDAKLIVCTPGQEANCSKLGPRVTNEQRLAALPEYLNEKQVEMLASTPTVVQNILQSSARFPYLKTLDLGGEAMTKAIVIEWGGKVRLINGYGPTEGCIDACDNENVTRDTDPNNIGYADGTGCRLWVVEPADRAKLTPIGCNGELLISGPTLARGYLNDAEKTSKAFIDCSAFEWAMKGDERCYATGDIVCRNADGSLTFIGRNDMQVQLHGVRIEVEEIEYVLGSCEGVNLAFVDKTTQEGTGTEMLVAFLLVEGTSENNTKEILHQPSESIRSIMNDACNKVQGRLPKYMNPRIYLPLRQIPTTTGGKIDRKQLLNLYYNTPSELLAQYKFQSVSRRSPNTQLQKELQRLWGQVLGNHAAQIGLDDDFLILGGDSLAAIKLATLAARKGLRLEVTDIFRSTKFEEMAAHIRIDGQNGPRPESKDPAPFSLLDGSDVLLHSFRDREDLEDIVPASSMQTSFITRAQKWYHPYYVWFMMDVDTQFSSDCLQAACNEVTARHQMLRTTFHLVGRQAYQIISKNTQANFKVLRFTGRMDELCCQLIYQDVKVPVEIGKVLTRFRLVVNNDTSNQRLCIGLSHAQYDGFCTEVVLQDIYLSCLGRLSDRKPPRYARYIAHSLEVSRNVDTNAFWSRTLEGSQMTTVGRPTKKIDASTMKSVLRSQKSTHERPGGMSPAIIVKTAWSLVLHRISNCSDTVFGSIVSGRNAPFEGAAEVVGPCLNLIPVRLKIDPSLTFMDLMKQAYEQQVAMIPYESTPMEQIVRQSPWPSSTRFGSVVLHQNIPHMAQEEGVDGPKWKYAGAAGYGEIIFDYTDCWLTTLPMADDCIKCWLSFNEEALPMSAADSIIDYFLAVMAMISDHPDRGIHTLETLPFDSGVYKDLQERQAAADDTPIRSPIPNSISNPPLPEHVRSLLQSSWKEVLSSAQEASSSPNTQQFTQVDEDASFFDLGGDSIGAVQLAGLCADSGIDMVAQDIYDFPTLNSQYQLLSGNRQRINRESLELVFVSADEIPA
ncbi:MAG: hypothetical protein Q9186_004064 [Xanthomendoza sp. 1 TL-2023]